MSRQTCERDYQWSPLYFLDPQIQAQALSTSCSVDKQIKSKKVFKATSTGMSNFLSEIVTLNPLKINLKISKSNKNAELLRDYLQNIFDEKIYLMN